MAELKAILAAETTGLPDTAAAAERPAWEASTSGEPAAIAELDAAVASDKIGLTGLAAAADIAACEASAGDTPEAMAELKAALAADASMEATDTVKLTATGKEGTNGEGSEPVSLGELTIITSELPRVIGVANDPDEIAAKDLAFDVNP